MTTTMSNVALRRPDGHEGRRGRTARALALLAALGLALAGCQGKLDGPAYPTATASMSAPTATVAPSDVWTRVSAGSADASDAPAILRTRYEVSSGQSSKTAAPAFSLRRSDDFGKTWVNLTPPQIPGVSYPASITYVSGAMSPLNPQIYILTLQLMNVACPIPQGANVQNICQVQYVTLDGGATWRVLTLPVTGVLGFFGPFGARSSNIFAQGTRLYSVINDVTLASSGVVPPGRLVVSDDGGATWRLADGALAAYSLLIYSFTAAPRGSSVFALVGATNNGLPGEQPLLALWRSDDAGATWQASSMPTTGESAMLATSDTSGHTHIYLITGGNAPRLFASANGGAHWTQCSEQSSTAPALLGALPNGAILLDTASAVEAWDGGAQAPVAIASPSGLFGAELAALQSQPDGSTRLWLVGQDMQGTVDEYTTLKLT